MIASARSELYGAQQSPLQQKVAAIEASMAKNKQMLGQYTWQARSQRTRRVKKQSLIMQLGPDGKPVKTDISQTQPAAKRDFGIRTASSETTTTANAALAQSYTQYQQGKLSSSSPRETSRCSRAALPDWMRSSSKTT